MNDLDLCLEVVSRSCQPLRDIRRWISRKPSEIETWFQRTTNRKWHTGYQIVTWPMTSRDPRRCCEAVWSAILATAWLLVFIFFILFSARKDYSALYANRPSVCHMGGSVKKRLKLGLWNFHHTVAPYTSIFCRVSFVQKFQQVLLSGGGPTMEGWEKEPFLRFTRQYLANGTKYIQSYC